MKISIIGAGNMGGAIARGLKNSDVELCCADRSTEVLNSLKTEVPKVIVTNDNSEAVKGADIVIIAVKPWLVETVIHEIKQNIEYQKQIVISIAAKVTFEKLCSYLKKEDDTLPALLRIIPNTAIEVKESVNFISSFNASKEQTETVKSLFDKLGLSFVIEERLLDAGTALASCGIAFAFRYIRAAVEGAVELGLYPEQAKQIEIQTLKGAVALLEAKNSHPEMEIDKVTTPGGITIKGLNAMEEAGFTNAVIKGLKASV
ncbi:MAG: pyrroline-5-carboxylate reductase [Tannerella sp.]|jgi:pyrroline-5-carboxylate reductase|nr:pyrroline-5-carboxylate reductase [Tannerella sp.]